MEKLKNNKGISLASVLVTVILMIIILSSIIYSNSRTNEIKESMYINSDIEELTKKVEIYYLEKGVLPLLEDNSSVYNYLTTKNGKDVVYYRLQIALLDNLNLNNKENIQKEGELNKGDQWYVINQQTHTIYFMKCLNNGEAGVPQEASYSNKYSDIIVQAESNGVFDTTVASTHLGTVEINNTTDTTSDLTGGFDTKKDGNNLDFNQSPAETTPTKPAYAKYIGWNNDGSELENDSSGKGLVLQYDGEYNTRTIDEEGNVIIEHKNSISTWSDLSGNGNDGSIVLNTAKEILEVHAESKDPKNDKITIDKWKNYNSNSNSNNNSIDLNKKFVISTNRNNIPSGKSNYTMEIVFSSESYTKDGGLLGLGTYNNVFTNHDVKYGDGTIVGIGKWSFKASRQARLPYINDQYNGIFNYEPYDWSVKAGSIDQIFAGSDGDGKSNAFRLNKSGGITSSYYWRKETDSKEYIETEGFGWKSNTTHTATVRYNGTYTEIFVDGTKIVENVEKSPDTIVNEITVGATNKQLKTTVPSPSWNYGMKFEFTYTEFLDGKVYSVRIYNRALTDTEIRENYEIDEDRFRSGESTT